MHYSDLYSKAHISLPIGRCPDRPLGATSLFADAAVGMDLRCPIFDRRLGPTWTINGGGACAKPALGTRRPAWDKRWAMGWQPGSVV